jgi:hypothetical protein
MPGCTKVFPLLYNVPISLGRSDKYHFANLILSGETKYEAKIKEKERTTKTTFV